MNIKDFENQTGIYPDALIFEAAKHELETAEIEWGSMTGFYHDFKFNTDGIAQKCQKIANERWIKANEEISRLRSSVKPLTDKCERLTAENGTLKEENESLFTELSELMKRVEVLNKQVEKLPTATLETTENDALARMKADMFNSLLEAAHEGHNGKTVLHMIFGFDFLLAQIACGGVADD